MKMLGVSDCFFTAKAVAAADSADLPGLQHPEAGRVHESVLHHPGPVLHLHAGELRVPACGETPTGEKMHHLLSRFTLKRRSIFVMSPQHGWNLKIHLVIGAEGISQQTENSAVSALSLFASFCSRFHAIEAAIFDTKLQRPCSNKPHSFPIYNTRSN